MLYMFSLKESVHFKIVLKFFVERVSVEVYFEHSFDDNMFIDRLNERFKAFS